MESAVQIRLVRENLALTISLLAAAIKGVITAGFLSSRGEVESGAGAVSVPFEVRDNQELVRCVNNQIRGAFAFSVLQTNRALESVYGNSPIQDEPSELRSARCILYLLSKSFHENLMDPVWICPTEYRQTFQVPSISFSVDASSLAGRKVNWVDFGGLSRYLDLLEFCSIRTAESGSPSGSTARDSVATDDCAVSPAQEPVPEEPDGRVRPPENPENPENYALSDAVELDSISSFVEARCLVNDQVMIIAKDLYDAYLGWCRREGYQIAAQRSFGMRLTALGFERRRRGKGKHWWMGIALTESQVKAPVS